MPVIKINKCSGCALILNPDWSYPCNQCKRKVKLKDHYKKNGVVTNEKDN